MSRNRETTKAEEKPEPPFCTIPEAARRLGASEFFVRQLCKSREIPCIRCGAKYLIDVEGAIEVLSVRARRAVMSK